MSITPHLVVQGAERAAAFYRDAFGAEELSRIPTPDGRLMSVQLRIGDGLLHLADEFPELGVLAPPSIGRNRRRPRPRRRRRGGRVRPGGRGRRQGSPAAGRGVLGRPPRPARRPLRASLERQPAPPRRAPRRDRGRRRPSLRLTGPPRPELPSAIFQDWPGHTPWDWLSC